MNNINIEVLNSFFEEKNIWLSNLNYLQEDYRILVDKIEKYQKIKNEFPSKSIIKKSIPKFISADNQDNIKLRKRLDNIMSVVMGTEKNDLTTSELEDLIEEEYKKDIAMASAEKLVGAISDGNFSIVGNIADNLKQISLGKSQYEKNNAVDSLCNIKTTNTKVSTGLNFGLGTGAEVTPKGALINLIGGSGFGKSVACIQSYVTNYLEGRNVFMANYEIDRVEIALRIKSFISKVPMQEIEKGIYSVSDNPYRVKAVNYVLKRVIDIETATKILIEGDLEKFKEYPLRTNKLGLVCSEGDYDYEEDFDQVFEEDDLPTDEELLKYLYKHGTELDDVYIDLITELEFQNPSHSEANDYKVFAKKIKRLAKKFSFRVWVLNQVENENTASGLLVNKYSKGIYQSCDINLVVIATMEMVEEGLVGIAVKKCRQGIANQVVLCHREFSINTFTPTGEILWLSEIQNKLKKQFTTGKN